MEKFLDHGQVDQLASAWTDVNGVLSSLAAGKDPKKADEDQATVPNRFVCCLIFIPFCGRVS